MKNIQFIPPLLLNIEEVAALLHCSPRYVQKLISINQMPEHIHLAGRRLWRLSTIEIWLQTLESTPTNPQVLKRGRPKKSPAFNVGGDA